MLPGRFEGHAICVNCADITTNLRCDRCGCEAERVRAGNCARCIAEVDLTELLQPTEPPDLRLVRLVHILIDKERVESVITWMRGERVNTLLQRIGTREMSLTHEAFDAYPHRTAAEHLRSLLEEHHMLPRRQHPYLDTFERWLDERIASLASTPDIQQPIERFARWHHLRKLHDKAPTVRNMSNATRSAKQEITEAGKFLKWLADERGATLAATTQLHVDEYVSEGPSTRRTIRNFLRYTNREWPGKRKLDLPHRQATHSPLDTQERRLELIRALIEWDDIEPIHRVTGLIFLLYGIPIVRIAALTVDDVTITPVGMTLNIGDEPAALPELFAPIIWTYYEQRMTTTTPTDRALFPSTRAGRHISPDGIRIALARYGISAQSSRNTTLRDLAAKIDASALAIALGYTAPTLIRHARLAGVGYASYAAAKARAASERADLH